MKTGTRIDNDDSYEFITKIGAGGNGTVYLLKNDDSFYVLKVAISKDQLSIETMDHEADIMREMENAGRQFRCVACSSDEGLMPNEYPWLVMDYVPGVNLNQLLESVRGADAVPLRTLKPVYKYSFIYGIAKELSFFHDQNMVHRDIKPENIFIDSDFAPRIGDMGDTTTNNVTKRQHGTVNFLPPEAIVRAGDTISITPAYDVYEFGGLLLQILTFEWPYSDLVDDEGLPLDDTIKERISNGELDERFEPGGELDNLLSPDDDMLYAIVKECWERNPGDRPTMDVILDHIDQSAEAKLSPDDFAIYSQYKEFLESGIENPLGASINIEKAINNGFLSLAGESSPLYAAAENLGIEIPDANANSLLEIISNPV